MTMKRLLLMILLAAISVVGQEPAKEPPPKENLSPAFAKAAFLAAGAIRRYDGTLQSEREMKTALQAVDFEAKEPVDATELSVKMLLLRLSIRADNDLRRLRIIRLEIRAKAAQIGGAALDPVKLYDAFADNPEVKAIIARQSACATEVNRQLKTRRWTEQPSCDDQPEKAKAKTK